MAHRTELAEIQTLDDGLRIVYLKGLITCGWALLVILPILAIRDVITALVGVAGASIVPFLIMRVVTISLVVVVLYGAKRWRSFQRRPLAVAWVLVSAMAVMVLWTIARLGGASSPVFGGLITVFAGWAYLFPAGWRQTTAIGSAIFVGYLVVIALGDGAAALRDPRTAAQCAMILGGVAIAAFANHAYTEGERGRLDALLTERKLAGLDPLTGCLNRRAIDERFRAEVGRAERFGGSLSCLMVDIDDFKRINDRFGHQAGDDTLRRTARVLLEAVGRDGVVGRWGGEEFFVVLPETSAGAAVVLANEIRRRLSLQIPAQGEAEVELTVSIGVSSTNDGGALTASRATVRSELVGRADSAMYLAKRSGKDQVVVAVQEVDPTRPPTAISVPAATPWLVPVEETDGRWLERVGLVGYDWLAALACALSLLYVPMDLLLGRFLGDERSMAVGVIGHLGIAGTLVACWYAVRHSHWLSQRIMPLHLVTAGATAVAASVISLHFGGVESPYFVGVMLFTLVFSFTIPGGAKWGAPLMALMTLSWPLTALVVASTPVSPVALLIRSTIILVLALICGFAHTNLHRVRRERALVRSRLSRLAMMDGLTGAQNRRGFVTRLDEELARAAQRDLELSLVVIDLDHLKQINDRHGHLRGDEALQLVAEVIRRNIRAIDLFGRLGGDEFALALPGTSLAGAEALARRLCDEIANSAVAVGDGMREPLSASFGVSSTRPGASTREELQQRADEALYVAKGAGRGLVALSDGTPRLAASQKAALRSPRS
ncbi:MAG: GGDEF domain-containing protein [Myxococcales bacterium]|nr:GGDEF domain-containing protein [Myxococcales bacterium]